MRAKRLEEEEEEEEEAKWLFFSLPNSNHPTLYKIDSQINR